MNINPDPQFVERCRAVYARWQRKEIEFAEASTLMEALRQEALGANEPAHEAGVEMMLGVMQGYRTNIDVSIGHFQNAHNLFRKVGNEIQANRCMMNIAELYRQKGDFSGAEQRFNAAYVAGKRHNDIVVQTVALHNRGAMLLALGHYESALAVLLESVALTEQWTGEHQQEALFRTKCDIYQSLAMTYCELKREPEAIEAGQQALELAKTDRTHLAGANRIMGKILTTFSSDDQPNSYFQKALDIYREVNAEGELARTLYEYAQCLIQQQNNARARKMLQRAIVIFGKLGMADDAARAAALDMGL